MGRRSLKALSRTLASVLSEGLNDHQTVIIGVESALAILTAMKVLELRC